MKNFLALMVLVSSVGAFAQERVELNSSKIEVNVSEAILVRTASSPDKVELTFNAPLKFITCTATRTERIHRTCARTENMYRPVKVCRTVVRTTTPSTSTTAPRGPRYNNPGSTSTPQTYSEEVCTIEKEYVGTRQILSDCSYSQPICIATAIKVEPNTDKIKLKFKNLPNLGGTEEDTFLVKARQREIDSSYVDYEITPIKTVVPYSVDNKGIFGADSYVIKVK